MLTMDDRAQDPPPILLPNEGDAIKGIYYLIIKYI
jgi:hypothetical protein